MTDAALAFDPAAFIIVACVFVVAGTVKGIVGFGLPAISVGLLTAAFDLPTAMGLMLVPAFLTNVWQAANGGEAGAVARRIWPFLTLGALTIFLGAAVLTRVDLIWLSLLLGVLLVVYGLISLSGIRLNITAASERWAAPALGFVNGLLSGMTGTFSVPAIMYFQGIGLSRLQMLQAMGMHFSLSTVCVALALRGSNLLSVDILMMSVAALVPTTLGLLTGRYLSGLMTETHYRQVFLSAVILLGLYIIARSILG